MSRPNTPARVPVPRSAADYTANVQDPDLRSQINASLLQQGHIAKIQNHLTQTLAASPSNWPQKISAHALNLIRSGECTTFPRLMERVMEDVRRDTENAREVGGEKKALNGNAENEFELAIPKKVEEEGVRVTRECLESVIEMTE